MALIYEKCKDETEKLQYIKSFKTVQTLFATHFHEITEIVYLESGKIETTINGTTFTAEEGDAIFINRFDLHSYKSEAGNLTHVFIMGKSLSEPFFRNIKGRFPSILKNKEANKEIFETVLKLIKFSGSDSLDTGICCLLLGLIEKFYPSVCTEKKETHLVRRIVDFIDKHFEEPITLSSLSAYFGHSSNYFSSLFNQYFGIHLKDYLNTVRVCNVKSLLDRDETNQLTVTDAYLKCGFDSQSTFYRSYSKAYGITPKGKNPKS